MPGTNEQMYLNRLRSWEKEKLTNKHGMQKFADRAVAVLRREIGLMWPEALKRHDAEPNASLTGGYAAQDQNHDDK